MIPTPKGYACERARETPPRCGLAVAHDWLPREIAPEEMAALLDGRAVEMAEGVLLRLAGDQLRTEVGECPKCRQGTVLGFRKGYRCDRESQCDFSVPGVDMPAEHRLPKKSRPAAMSALLAGRAVDLIGGGRLEMAVDPDGRAVPKTDDPPCPRCGQGKVFDTRGTYRCDRAPACGFDLSCGVLARQAGLSREIAPSEMAVLLATGEVELQEGVRLRLGSGTEEPVTLLTNAGTCPHCGQGRVWRSKDGHECERAPACDFAMSHAGLPWAPTLEEVDALLDGRKTDLSEDLRVERRNNRAGTMTLFAAVRRGSLRSDIPARGDEAEPPGDAEIGRWTIEMSEGARLVAARPGSGEVALSVEVGTCPQCKEDPALWHPRCVFCGGSAEDPAGCGFRVYPRGLPGDFAPGRMAAFIKAGRIDLGWDAA